jgi:hypothetical protein
VTSESRRGEIRPAAENPVAEHRYVVGSVTRPGVREWLKFLLKIFEEAHYLNEGNPNIAIRI